MPYADILNGIKADPALKVFSDHLSLANIKQRIAVQTTQKTRACRSAVEYNRQMNESAHISRPLVMIEFNNLNKNTTLMENAFSSQKTYTTKEST